MLIHATAATFLSVRSVTMISIVNFAAAYSYQCGSSRLGETSARCISARIVLVTNVRAENLGATCHFRIRIT